MSEDSSSRLLQHTKDGYGESFNDHLLEQYKLYVESAERISERRITANNYLLTVNASLVTLYGLLAASQQEGWWAILVPVAGVLVSLGWCRIIASYSSLNAVKFEVIHEIEMEMPAALYRYEWHKAGGGRGGRYRPVSHLERWIPIIFILLYISLATVALLGAAQ